VIASGDVPLFEGGLPEPIWGDIFLAAGLAAIGYELYKVATSGLVLEAPKYYVDIAFVVVGFILVSTGLSMKQGK